MDWFKGSDLTLQHAIDKDSPEAVEAAVRAGANVNAKGLGGVRPAMYAIGQGRASAFERLLKLGADLSARDDEGDNAMTIAANAYAKRPEFLLAALKAGGDPNTKRSDNDPLIMRFVADNNLEAIKMLAKHGADVSARSRTKAPIVVDSAIAEDWDVVWTLLELGAKFDYPDEPNNMTMAFNTPGVTPPDSPLFPYKVKCWRFLTAKGLKLPDLSGVK